MGKSQQTQLAQAQKTSGIGMIKHRIENYCFIYFYKEKKNFKT